MVKIGYKPSIEEFGPLDLVCFAKQAGDAGLQNQQKSKLSKIL
ncbi:MULTISPECIES: hypothetical protein [Methanobacterium]|nr:MULTISPECIES: hypothetical protein [Methanobacterium]